MHRKHLRFGNGFRILLGDKHSQAARPGEIKGGPDNRHRGADQWFFVVSGTGQARINGKTLKLRLGKLLLIQRGDRHEIRNTGRTLLRTLNIYVPPAYTKDGEERTAGKA